MHPQHQNVLSSLELLFRHLLAKKFFFAAPSEKKFLRLKKSKIWGSDHTSGGEIWGLGVSERPKIFFRKDPSRVL